MGKAGEVGRWSLDWSAFARDEKVIADAVKVDILHADVDTAADKLGSVWVLDMDDHGKQQLLELPFW